MNNFIVLNIQTKNNDLSYFDACYSKTINRWYLKFSSNDYFIIFYTW